jgi:hypothetical protein
MRRIGWAAGAAVTVSWAIGAPPVAATPQQGLVTVPAETGQLLLGADASSRLGTRLSGTGDNDGDGRPDLLTGVYGSFTGGAGLVLRGGLGGTLALSGPSLLPAAGYAITGATFQEAPVGWSSGSVGDVNADGRPDIAFSRAYGNGIRVVYGRPGPRPTVAFSGPIAPQDGFDITGVYGESLTAAGDVNADGVGDLAIGTPGQLGYPDGSGGLTPDPPLMNPTASLIDGPGGEALVVFGRAGQRSTLDAGPKAPASDVLRIGKGPLSATAAGDVTVSPAGDVNGDKVADVLVGAPGVDAGRGRAYVLYGGAALPAFIELSDDLPLSRGFAMVPPPGVKGLGTALADVGDVNGDGLADVTVTAPDAGSGLAWTVFGRPLGAAVPLSVDGFALGQVFVAPPTAGSPTSTASAGARFGVAADGVGDVNGDRRPDLVFGAPGTSAKKAGAAYVVYSPAAAGKTALPATAALPPSVGFAIRVSAADAATMGAGLGKAVAGLGDGRIAIGAPDGGGGSSGVVHVVSGRAPAKLRGLLNLTAKLTATTVRTGRTLPLVVGTSEAAETRVTLYRVGKQVCADEPVPGFARSVCRPSLQRVAAGRLGGSAADGSRTLSLPARANGKALAAGSYLAAVRAVAGAKRSVLRPVAFTITK